jgi:hypothetical protein
MFAVRHSPLQLIIAAFPVLKLITLADCGKFRPEIKQLSDSKDLDPVGEKTTAELSEACVLKTEQLTPQGESLATRLERLSLGGTTCFLGESS